jgi:hypothetical protein
VRAFNCEGVRQLRHGVQHMMHMIVVNGVSCWLTQQHQGPCGACFAGPGAGVSDGGDVQRRQGKGLLHVCGCV